jgi:RimJ/RimL family protein N-acetyltransferase
MADVALVPMGETHLAATHRWLSESAELRRQVDSLAPPTVDGNRAYWVAKWGESSREDYAIVAGDVHVGNCGLTNIDKTRRKAELWIYLGDTRGRGIGGRALGLLLDRGFKGLYLNKIYLRVVSDNPKALHFYETAGFRFEGRLRQDSIHDGAFVDSICMSLLASEYEEASR